MEERSGMRAQTSPGRAQALPELADEMADERVRKSPRNANKDVGFWQRSNKFIDDTVCK